MKKILKASGTLSLSLIVCFTMLFAEVGIASAESTTTSLGQRGNVKEIKYIYPSSLTYEENTNGQWSIDENGEFFYRYNMNSDCEPEVFTVEYESSEEVTYSRYSGAGDAYWSRSEYKSSTGEKITLTNCVKSNQPEKHFKVGKDNYFTFTFKGATKKIPVGITASTVITTVQSIKYIPKTIGYDYSDAELVYNGAKNEGQWCFPFAYHHHSGDKLVVTDAAGNEKTYTYQDGYIATVENGTEWVDAKFISTDGKEINPDLVYIYDDQDLYEWGYGKECYLVIEYDGALTKVPITVQKNDVESISIYVGEDSEEHCFSCDEEDWYIRNHLDGIIVHKQDGSTETIKYYDSKYNKYEDCETDGYFDSEGNFANLTICHKDFAESGQWYVYYHGVSCPIKTSHHNTSWDLKTKPTCKTTGLYEKVCICGEVVDTAVIPVDENAHKFTSYVYNNDAEVGVDGTETASCDYGCGKTDTRTKSGTALSDSSSIEGILADYYIYRFNTLTGELTLSCKENATAPNNFILEQEFRKSSLYEYCDIVKKVHLSSSVTPPKSSSYYYTFKNLEAFVVDEGNAYYSSESGVLFNKEKTILYRYPIQKKDEVYTIPNSVTEIRHNEDDSPFELVRYLKTVKIPATVSKIYENSFVTRESGNGNSIESFIVDSENPSYKSIDGVLFSKDGKTLITFPSNKAADHYTIPENVNKIGDNAFDSTRKLKKVTVPEGVEEIGSKAFLTMIGYKSELTIPASVKKINNEAFGWLGNSGGGYRIINFTRNSKLEEFPYNAFSRLGGGALIRIPCKTWTVDLECTVELTHEGEWKTEKEATSTESGLKTRTCTVCGTPEQEIIPALDESDTDYIAIDEEQFPDTAFREYVADVFDSNEDLKLSKKELEAVVEIDLHRESEIESLQGIEYFTNLKKLYCDNTKVKFLDVPKLKKLETAYFKHTPLEYLALDSENLHDLHVYDTNLDTDGLDCNLKGIEYLNISDTNISEIDLSNSKELRSLFCSNTPISKLDLSNNTKLELLTCDNTSIKELILSDNHEVDAVDARNCNLIAFELSDQYDISDFDEKYEDGLDFGEEGILINFKNQNINTIPNGKTRFDLSEWAPNIDTSRISNLKGATLSGTTLSGFTAGSQITYDYDCGAGYTMNVVINAPKDTSSSASSGGGGGGFILPSAPIQKPTVSAGSGYTTTLGKDGSTLEITLENGYKLDDVLVNGISKGVSLSLTGLKDGDKVEIKVSKEEVSNTEQIKAQLAELTKDNFKARSAQIKLKSGKKAIKITWTNPNGIKFDGVEIFRSSKKNSGYGKKPYYTSKSNKYCNTAIKQGSRYYYKVRGYVEVDGVKYYSAWSAKAWRTVR